MRNRSFSALCLPYARQFVLAQARCDLLIAFGALPCVGIAEAVTAGVWHAARRADVSPLSFVAAWGLSFRSYGWAVYGEHA